MTLPHTREVRELTGYNPLPESRFGWYGDDSLAAMIPRNGVYRLSSTSEVKLPWWRFLAGTVEIFAERTDQPATQARALGTDGYGAFGSQPSGVTFGSFGCWRVTGRIRDHALTFVFYLEQIP